MENMGVTYSEIRGQLKTGDLVLFGGKGRISSLIKRFTRSPYSHVGMIIRTELGVLLWESTTLSNVEDVFTGKAHKGPQVVMLSDRIRTYEGEIYVRPIRESLAPVEIEALHEFRHEIAGRPYEVSEIELIRAVMDIGPDQKEDLSSIFCSEQVVEAFQRMGRISERYSSNEFTPHDLGTDFRGIFGDVVELVA